MFPTERLLEFAYAAYRINNGYVKSSTYDYTTNIRILSNKEIVLYSAIKEFRPIEYYPPDFVPLEVTEQDRESVKLALEHYKRYTMLLLGADLTPFQRDVFAVISQDTVSMAKVGLIAAVPTVVKNEKAENSYLRRLKKDFYNSQHYSLKQTVTGNIEILKRIYLKDFNIYLYFAGMNENLISFTKPVEYEVGEVYSLIGKVKSLETERETGIKMTKINYVKLNTIEVFDAY